MKNTLSFARSLLQGRRLQGRRLKGGRLKGFALFIGMTALAQMGMTAAAQADSCWDHNGSVMRLKASGNQRWFYYEIPRDVLRRAGVRRGTLLFNGNKDGNWYSGISRVYSRHCPGSPLEYFVEGPVRDDQLKVTMRGTREVSNRCVPTGRMTTDTLVFTYRGRC